MTNNIFTMDIWINNKTASKLYQRLSAKEKTFLQYVDFEHESVNSIKYTLEYEILDELFYNNLAMFYFTLNNLVDKGVIEIRYKHEYPENHKVETFDNIFDL